MNCGTCRNVERSEADGFGLCHLNPPQVVVVMRARPDSTSVQEPVSFWPAVKLDQRGCAYHAPDGVKAGKRG